MAKNIKKGTIVGTLVLRFPLRTNRTTERGEIEHVIDNDFDHAVQAIRKYAASRSHEIEPMDITTEADAPPFGLDSPGIMFEPEPKPNAKRRSRRSRKTKTTAMYGPEDFTTPPESLAQIDSDLYTAECANFANEFGPFTQEDFAAVTAMSREIQQGSLTAITDGASEAVNPDRSLTILSICLGLELIRTKYIMKTTLASPEMD